MKKSTQRILAIVLVAVIGVGIGTGAYFFLVTEAAEYKWEDVPGAPDGISQNRIIKFGVLDDMGYITGEGAANGAWMAAYEINQRGGIEIDNETYYIGIETEDTEEANPALDISRGVAAAERMIHYKKAQFLLGGFRTEALQAYREIAMKAKKLFFITGSATAKFCQDVLSDYDKYKYTFRIQPLNEVFLAFEIIHMLSWTLYSEFLQGNNITKIAIIRENLAWTIAMSSTFQLFISIVSNALYGNPTTISVVKEIAYPQTAGPLDFYGYWSEIAAEGTEITIPIISGPTGLYYSNAYGGSEQTSLSLGINVMGQQSVFWDQSLGACEYEIEMTSFIRHNKTPFTIPFWDHYLGNFSKAPIYTATGAYDAIQTYVTAIIDAQSLDTDDIIAELEKSEWQSGAGIPNARLPKYGMGSPTATAGYWTDGTDPKAGLVATRHDVVEGTEEPLGFGHAVFVQWMYNVTSGEGYWECLPCGGIPGFPYGMNLELYPESIATANLTWPVR